MFKIIQAQSHTAARVRTKSFVLKYILTAQNSTEEAKVLKYAT